MDVLKPADYDENPDRYKKISIVVVSDTHKNHRKLSIPNGDIFLHCGDFTNRHDWYNLSDDKSIPKSVIDFNDWLGTLPHRHKIVICGNHDIGFEKFTYEEIQSKLLTNCKYLQDELIEIEGITIYGCPWPFSQHYRTKWPSVPSHVDLLMTHAPPQFILDLAFQPKRSPVVTPCSMCNGKVHGSYGHWGSRSLVQEIRERIQPRVHCFGHVHDDAGYKYDSGTLFINAATDLTKQSFKFIFYIDLHK
ncbi:hypothetical protein I4U23_003618 [Adineta vaga]|nr:hypothetical protein I4U23_003618 [Adineta vaga]